MMEKKKKNRIVLFIFLGILLAITIVIVSSEDIRKSIGNGLASLTSSNDANANKIKVSRASITGIETGTATFDESDGISDLSSTSGYIAGNDASSENRIVRSFDSITYAFNFNIVDKAGTESYSDRTVSIEVELSAEEANYVAFDENSMPGETNHTYTFDGINSGTDYDKTITLYVLGAPNGTSINPKFLIKESTDEENEILLGKVSSSEYYYSIENDTYNNTAFFTNVLPTVVSSKAANVKMENLYINNNQTGTYNGSNGRYVTVVNGLYIEGDSLKGLKGMDMPTGPITFNTAVSHTGQSNIVLKNEWARLYGVSKVDDIDSILVDAPYSAGDSGNSQKEVKTPGTFTSELEGNTYKTTVSGYTISNSFATLTATDQGINNKYYIGTYAYSVFSPRSSSETRSTITVNFNVDSISANGTNSEAYQIDGRTVSIDNNYLQATDYSYESGFYMGENKLNNDNKIGSLSKGTEVLYKTTYENKNASSNEGIKEVIKINPTAFRIISFDDENEINYELKCGEEDCTEITKDDFEVKYITGDYKNSNYEIDTINSRLSSDVKDSLRPICENLDITQLSNDQMMNLYGNPCLKTKDDVEKEFDKISDAVDSNNEEIPITKIVVQTKSGVKVPSNAKVIINYKLKVRNVPDITRVYQVTSVATTSDYDSVLKYYSPFALETLNPDNYQLPVIQGKDVVNVTETEYADSVRISNFTSDQKITVLNKDDNDEMKTVYDTADSEVITYNIEPIIEDNSEKSGSDDTWIMESIRLEVHLPSNLTYIPDSNIDQNLTNVSTTDSETILSYTLPYSKPNFENTNIRFQAIINPKLKGSNIPITIRSYLSAQNVNGETDSALYGVSYKDFTVYANGTESVILEQRVGSAGTNVDADSEFSYLLSMYNNTNNQVDNYAIMDILPYDKDDNGSRFSGSYEVKIVKPESLNSATIYCSSKESDSLTEDINDSSNNWTECNDITSTYKNITAFKVTGISIEKDKYTNPIEVLVKPSNNNASDTYSNSFIGGLSNSLNGKSNIVNVSVISRSISGKVFYDNNENGIQDEGDTYVPDVEVSLYKINNGQDVKIGTTSTNDKGKYLFKNLEKGSYYLELDYNGAKYDLTRRYASIDESIDSDAYKISETKARIANKKIPNDPLGISLTNEDINLENYDMGLISKSGFSLDIEKYITRTELSYNGNFVGKDYNNEKRVTVNVNNTTNATIKVFYGIDITNNSEKSGYVDELEETIPSGLIFDSSLPENQDWIMIDGKVISSSLSSILIKPGETKHLQIVLYMSNNQSAGVFTTTVSIVKMTEYVPVSLVKEKEYQNQNKYEVGEDVDFAGISWHVIKTVDNSDNSQMVTLLADSGQIDTLMSHNSGDLYKWGLSNIKNYLDSNGMNSSLDYSVIEDTAVCNDSSGMEIVSYGGNVLGSCQSNDFVYSKVRLLSSEEYTSLVTSSLSNIDWLTGDRDYWLQSADDTRPIYEMIGANQDDSYGVILTSSSNKAMYVSSAGIRSDLSSSQKEIRPVITISSRNILFE